MGKPIADGQAGFAGGLNTTGDPSAIRPDQARQLANCRLGAYGAATRRGGSRFVSDAIGAMISSGYGAGIYWPSTSTIVVSNSSKLFTASLPANFAVPTWSLSFTDKGAWGSAAWTSGFVIFTDGTTECLYGTQSGGALRKWNNTAISSPSGAAACAGIVVYNGRLWGWNSSASPNSLYYSNLAAAVGTIGGDSLGVAASGGGQILVQTYSATQIYACCVVGASLLIFQDIGTSRLTGLGQDDIAVDPQPLSTECSIMGPRSYCATSDAAYVATKRGIYRVTESSAIPLGTPERPDPTISLLAAESTSVRMFYNTLTNEVWVLPVGGGAYVYHTMLQSWSGPWNGVDFMYTDKQVPFTIKDQLGKSRVVMPPTVTSEAKVREVDSPDYFKDSVAVGGTGGSAYSMTIQCHRMFANERTLSKTWRKLSLLAAVGDTGVDPVVTVSGKLGTSTTTVAVTATPQDVYYVRTGTVGPYVDVTITDAGVSASQYVGVNVEGFLLGER